MRYLATHLLKLFVCVTLSLILFGCEKSSNQASSKPNSRELLFNTGSNFDLLENTSLVTTISSTDTQNNPINYQLSGGEDQSFFIINNDTGALAFIAAPDFENPLDADTNNSYNVQVQAFTDDSTIDQLITVNVINQNDLPPSINSNDTVLVTENFSTATTLSSTDPDGDSVLFTLSGGADHSLFSINAQTGTLTFTTPPDYENPSDDDGNNTYELEVTVSDGIHNVIQNLQITVTDLNESNSGLAFRPSNASCVINNAPELSADVALTRVFPTFSFSDPIALRQSPSNRWYVAEQRGIIRTFFEGDRSATLFADLRDRISSSGEKGLLGMALHPDFSNNGYMFLYYSTEGGPEDHQSVISRFTTQDGIRLDADSEFEILRINQPFSNHNGGNVLFGPDGYLYIGLGDGGSANDPQDNAQNISSILGKMLRIDVDNTANGNNYAIPSDNPYVGIDGLDEIFAIGLRNPWRWSFDQHTGELFAGDVGQDRWEEIDLIVKGGNFGWRCYEGNNPLNRSNCQPIDEYQGPIYEYDHSQGFSVTGGYVYRGSAIPSLFGSYLFSDFGPGPIWKITNPSSTNPGSTNPASARDTSELITANFLISAFAEDNDNELYVLNFSNGQVFRIDPPSSVIANDFPEQLSETGCIDNTTPLKMASGLIPYDVNAEFWSDGADKTRWMALPDNSEIVIENDGDWTYPSNSVLVKNFHLNGRRIETRLLARHADGSWGGYSYEWNDAETDARLVLNGKNTPKENQNYIFPSTSDCVTCHTSVSGISLGPDTQQLNRDLRYPSTGILANQLLSLESIGLFTNALSDHPINLAKLTNPDDTTASPRDRARAYLHTNCAHCHQSGGPTGSDLDLHINTADSQMNICNQTLTHPIGTANVIMSPGNAANSSLVLRMNCRAGVSNCNEGDEMPPLGSALVDDDGVNIVSGWINALAECP